MSNSMLRSPDLPLALVALAVFLGFAFQTVELVQASESLVVISHNQDAPLQETARLKQAVDSLASDITDLSQQGDTNAKQILDEMAKQNIQLRPSQPADAPAK